MVATFTTPAARGRAGREIWVSGLAGKGAALTLAGFMASELTRLGLMPVELTITVPKSSGAITPAIEVGNSAGG